MRCRLPCVGTDTVRASTVFAAGWVDQRVRITKVPNKRSSRGGGWLGAQSQKRSHDASLRDRTKANAATTLMVTTAVMEIRSAAYALWIPSMCPPQGLSKALGW